MSAGGANKSTTQFWVPDSVHAFTKVERDPHDENFLVVHKQNGQAAKVPVSQGYPVNPKDVDGCDDNTNLTYLHAPGMLQNMRVRYDKDKIYTYTGYILLAVNPYHNVDIYNDEWIAKYRNKSIGLEAPHVFAIADQAFRNMKAERVDQSIMVSGESGAGKTESAKKVMQFLVKVGGKDNKNMQGVENRIIDTNPLLEAFGNAKTTRNNNSSRFGKFIRLVFEGHKNPVVKGALIDTYLLEKARIVQQSTQNRNFHIFYFLCCGASAADKKAWELKDPEHFHYINQGGDYRIEGMSDAHEYKIVREAMDHIGIPMAEQQSCFRIISGLLHMGNVTIAPGKGKGSKVTGEAALKVAAKLLEINPADLSRVLVQREMRVRGEVMNVELSAADATIGRDSLVKFIYHGLFVWLVRKINESLAVTDDDSNAPRNSISILDIFGFEYFDNNGFEQFCINYCNEKLQQEFNRHVFKAEKDIYAREAIRTPDIDFQDNQETIDLIEGRGTGLIAILDEQCKLANGTGQTLALAIQTRHKDRFIDNKPKDWKDNVTNPEGRKYLLGYPKYKAVAQAGRGVGKTNLKRDEAFVIMHYAADVCYETSHFIMANNDSITLDLQGIVKTSTDGYLKAVCEAEVDRMSRGSSKKSQQAFHSVAAQFAEQLRDLVESLNQTTCHFIRCIKPNAQQKPHIFEPMAIHDQLHCNGMFDALRLMEAGYPARLSYQTIFDRFKDLVPQSIRHITPKLFSEALIMSLGKCDRADFELGLTRVFFRAGKLAFIEDLRGSGKDEIPKDIGLRVRTYVARKRWRQAFHTIRAHIRITRRLYQIRGYRKLQEGIRLMAIVAPTWVRLGKKVRMGRAALQIQTKYRGYRCRKYFVDLRYAATLAQSIVRMKKVAHKYRGELMKRMEKSKAQAAAQRQQLIADQERKRKEAREAEEAEEAKRRAVEEAKRKKEEEAQRKKEEEERRRREEEERKAREEMERREMELKVKMQLEQEAVADKKIAAFREEYDAKVSELETELASRAKVSDDDLAKLRRRISELEAELARVTAERDSLADELAQTKASAKKREASFKDRLEELENRVVELTSESDETNDKLAAVSLDKSQAESRAAGLTNDVTELTAQLADAKQSASARIADLEMQVQQAQKVKTSTEANLKAQTARANEAEEELESIQARMGGVDPNKFIADKAALASKVNVLSAQVAELTDQVEDYEIRGGGGGGAVDQAAVNAKNQEIRRLTVTNTEMTVQIENMKEAVAEAQRKAQDAAKRLASAVDEHQAQYRAAALQISELETDLAQAAENEQLATSQLDRLKARSKSDAAVGQADFAGMQSENEHLRAQLDAQNARVKRLQEEVRAASANAGSGGLSMDDSHNILIEKDVAEVRLKDVSRKLEERTTALVHLQQEHDDLLSKTRKSGAAAEVEAQAFDAKIANFATLLEQAHADHSKMQAEHAALLAQKADDYEAFREENQDLHNQLEALRARLSDTEESAAAMADRSRSGMGNTSQALSDKDYSEKTRLFTLRVILLQSQLKEVQAHLLPILDVVKTANPSEFGNEDDGSGVTARNAAAAQIESVLMAISTYEDQFDDDMMREHADEFIKGIAEENKLLTEELIALKHAANEWAEKEQSRQRELYDRETRERKEKEATLARIQAIVDDLSALCEEFERHPDAKKRAENLKQVASNLIDLIRVDGPMPQPPAPIVFTTPFQFFTQGLYHNPSEMSFDTSGLYGTTSYATRMHGLLPMMHPGMFPHMQAGGMPGHQGGGLWGFQKSLLTLLYPYHRGSHGPHGPHPHARPPPGPHSAHGSRRMGPGMPMPSPGGFTHPPPPASTPQRFAGINPATPGPHYRTSNRY